MGALVHTDSSSWPSILIGVATRWAVTWTIWLLGQGIAPGSAAADKKQDSTEQGAASNGENRMGVECVIDERRVGITND